MVRWLDTFAQARGTRSFKLDMHEVLCPWLQPENTLSDRSPPGPPGPRCDAPDSSADPAKIYPCTADRRLVWIGCVSISGAVGQDWKEPGRFRIPLGIEPETNPKPI